jgi:hypothetical protein
MPLELIRRKGQEYDKDRYCEMLLDAAETLLGYFSFDRDYMDILVEAKIESGDIG